MPAVQGEDSEPSTEARGDAADTSDSGDVESGRKRGRKRKKKDKKEGKKKGKKKDKKKKDSRRADAGDDDEQSSDGKAKLKRKFYEKELERLQAELVKLQYWIKQHGLRVVVVFEGRDAAGKGGAIKRVEAPLNPRGCRVVALATPTDREKTQWYFQRYVAHLPEAGEIVLFDRSWYNRAGVERVMGFCTKQEYKEFLRACPEFEGMLLRSGITLIKYWFSVSGEEQEKRFRERAKDPSKRWKISGMDLEARARWVEFSKAKDVMFDHTDNSDSPWWVVQADDKRRARLNFITHLLSQFKYTNVRSKDKIKLPKRQTDDRYKRPPREKQRFVPDVY